MTSGREGIGVLKVFITRAGLLSRVSLLRPPKVELGRGDSSSKLNVETVAVSTERVRKYKVFGYKVK